MFHSENSDLEFNANTITYWKVVKQESIRPPSRKLRRIKKIKAYEQLVLLGFAVTSFTPIAYQRSRLLRLLKVNSS